MVKSKRWVMPKWMEPYRDDILNTGGNTVEDLVNGNTKAAINLPLAILEVAVSSQVGLLSKLYSEGRLPKNA